MAGVRMVWQASPAVVTRETAAAGVPVLASEMAAGFAPGVPEQLR